MKKFNWVKEKKIIERNPTVYKSIYLRSPDGTAFELLVDNEGTLFTKKRNMQKMMFK